MPIHVRFYPPKAVEDNRFRFVVIATRCQEKWLLCKHRERETWEFPGGHREQGESWEQAARRKLWEETGATRFTLEEVCAYSVLRDGEETFGMLCAAEVAELGPLPPLEIGSVELFENLPAPSSWTYPDIQPRLLEYLIANPEKGSLASI